nr:hypothetical protein GCM10017544_00030 [Microbacterium imperiale]
MEEPGLDADLTPKADLGEESYRGSGRLTGRKALITGGDSGIGAATAIAFAREGADVAISYLPQEEEDAQRIAGILKEAGVTVAQLPGDLRDPEYCRSLVADTVSALGGIDILVNNGGKQIFQESLADLTDEQFDDTFKTNVYAMFWITKAALPHLPAGASIINTTSIQAYSPSETLVDYASTKATINTFTKALAQQLAPQGIRVNAVAPAPSGRRCSRATASRRRRSRASARRPRSDAWASPRSSRRHTCSSRRPSRATSPVRRSTSTAACPRPDADERPRSRAPRSGGVPRRD